MGGRRGEDQRCARETQDLGMVGICWYGSAGEGYKDPMLGTRAANGRPTRHHSTFESHSRVVIVKLGAVDFPGDLL